MRLSKKSEYACLALIELAGRYKEEPVKTEEISKKQKIPKKYLEQILLQLKSSGYVRSIRGASGGYELSKHPKKISVAEIIRLIDGPIAPVESVSKYFYSKTPMEKSNKLIKIFRDIRDYTSNRLEKTNFEDLV